MTSPLANKTLSQDGPQPALCQTVRQPAASRGPRSRRRPVAVLPPLDLEEMELQCLCDADSAEMF